MQVFGNTVAAVLLVSGVAAAQQNASPGINHANGLAGEAYV